MPRPQRARRGVQLPPQSQSQSPQKSNSASPRRSTRSTRSSPQNDSETGANTPGSDPVFGAEASWANVRARISPQRSPQRPRHFDIYQDMSSPGASLQSSPASSPDRSHKNSPQRRTSLKRSPLKPLTTREALERMPVLAKKARKADPVDGDENAYAWPSEDDDDDTDSDDVYSDVEYGSTAKDRKRIRRDRTPAPREEPPELPPAPEEDIMSREQRIAATRAKFAEIDDFPLEFEDISSET